jgi:hypothetical protein
VPHLLELAAAFHRHPAGISRNEGAATMTRDEMLFVMRLLLSKVWEHPVD